MDELAQEVLDATGATEEGWEYENDMLTCPCGHRVEDDGECPEGHVSPFRAAGMI